MDPTSFVSKARTAFHSAAAKAERVLTDFKSNREEDSEKRLASLQDEAESTDHLEIKHLQLKWRPSRIGTKQDWQDRFRNITGRKGVEEPVRVENSAMGAPFFNENLYMNVKNDLESKASEVSSLIERLNATNVNSIPSSSVLKQLALAVENGKMHQSIKDFLASFESSSPIMERASLSLSAVKSLVLHDREDKLASDFSDDEKVPSLIHSLFDAGV